jgi:acyl-CoA synthetase (AMP-forming)/AMP-acid ligase II
VRSAVIGRSVQGTEGGEEVVAFVELSPGSPISQTELAQHAAQHLAPYKRPSQIVLVSSMPLTPTGKVIKSELAKLVQFAHTR